ncbi:MAG: helix-turn-helix domain-containing protein [Verrucomicrobia subdivision 3 bacterium]|nr:helix-turn-helix domain-containing protein [Limisphaerales bacterium]
MSTVAEQLRHAREQQKLNIYQVAEITKIKTDHIRALEAGQYDAFSAPVYIRGFVRTYAKALKLDVAQVTAMLDSELSRTERFKEPPALTNEPRSTLDFLMLQLSRLNWRIVGTALGASLVLLVLFFSLRGCRGKQTDPLKTLGPGIYHPTNATGELLPLPERRK